MHYFYHLKFKTKAHASALFESTVFYNDYYISSSFTINTIQLATLHYEGHQRRTWPSASAQKTKILSLLVAFILLPPSRPLLCSSVPPGSHSPFSYHFWPSIHWTCRVCVVCLCVVVSWLIFHSLVWMFSYRCLMASRPPALVCPCKVVPVLRKAFHRSVSPMFAFVMLIFVTPPLFVFLGL